MCTVLTALTAISTVAGAAGSFMQGRAAQQSANAQAAAERANARIAEEQARDSVKRGGLEELKLRRQLSIHQGQQRALLAASGVDIDSGSPLDLQMASINEGAQDMAATRFNAAREAWGYDVQAANHRNAASAARAAGQNAMTQGLLGAGTSLLSAVTPYAGGSRAIKTKKPVASWYDEKALGHGGYSF